MSWDAVSAISTAFTGFVALLALIAAIAGLNTWKKQSLATERHQLAKRLIQNLYRRKLAIETIRNPFSQHDLSKYMSPEIDPKRRLWLATIDEAKNRFNKLEEQKSAVQPDLLEADLILSKLTTQTLREFEELEKTLIKNLNANLEATRPPPSDDFPDDYYDEDHIKSLNENGRNIERRRIIFGAGGTGDEFNNQIERAYAACVDELKKHLINRDR